MNCKKIDSASLFTRGMIKNFILSCFNFCKMERANCFHEYLLNSLSAIAASKVNECLKTIHEAFRVVIYIKLKPKECKITYLLYTFYNLIVLYLKVQKFQLFYAFFAKK